ncbi:putative ATPase of the ABC class [Corynebacterium occultum]|uniref:Putative ATPase of the ABC class n=1 Tax=Corynebacterium occultum TaxID=2675219 RepID=A0A6B8W4U7_9CORY|nr:ABC-ATPase domain-containing protein [Corynebacterium occultum]QGU06957.1 putative ATPase of the ABC class [Corynebacterium occultum]
MTSLAATLRSIDGRGYGDYRQIRGRHQLPGCELSVDHIQADPYAPASLIRLLLANQLPAELMDTPAKRVAAGDFIARRVAGELGQDFSIGPLGQEILPRTAVLIDDPLELRLSLNLPAAGRRIKGRAAQHLLCERLPQIAALLHNLDLKALRQHVELYLDQLHLQSQLSERNLVAFIGNGSILPRRAGDSDEPLTRGVEVFQGPDSLRHSFDLPSGRQVAGMGIPAGISLIVGGGYHGKSTLLRAVARGVYPHIAGDGREWVLTRADAVSIRAEDGRSISGVNISPFLADLPGGVDTTSFSTTNASGSTSQAANLVEALEVGTSLLLIDEDTSATNFMIRDQRMRALIPAGKEPITPFIDRVVALRDELGISTLLVAGGSGDYLDVADHVIAMDSYVPRDATDEAGDVLARFPGAPPVAPPADFTRRQRVPLPASLHPADKHKPARARGAGAIQYGRNDIDLRVLSQLVDPGQTQAIALALEYLAGEADGRSLRELLAQLYQKLDVEGLDGLSPHPGHPGHYSLPRPQEVLAALNRWRGLEIN